MCDVLHEAADLEGTCVKEENGARHCYGQSSDGCSGGRSACPDANGSGTIFDKCKNNPKKKWKKKCKKLKKKSELQIDKKCKKNNYKKKCRRDCDEDCAGLSYPED